MNYYLLKYKPFLLFLLKFFLTYGILTLVYQGYLNSFGFDKVDGITQAVGRNTKELLDLFGAPFSFDKNSNESYLRLFYNGKYVARIIEGCNSVSVLILFMAFVVSFSGTLKATLLFLFGGVALIYLLNVVRIAVLCVLLFYFPEQEAFLHRIFFPLFIYGFVFLLWILWISNFSKYAKKNTPV
ncbi:exosortase family protein XrtF [Flavobacterium sp. 7A]|uniref:exosortase family protein XrtF n=1 Tax=Flavobacterium sp. 7A TaxID=2940571 RepID=UPI0022265E9E|nr:exosortase family protein XrtF [Flavobacterium sp. 7A]MCW2119093.1 exosortase family protein XrtF [Flavobacterium sp. 7A]